MKPELYLDGDSPLQSLRIGHSLSKNYSPSKLCARRSSSRRGWHFHVLNERHNTRVNLKLREILHDCRGRIKADRIRRKLGLPTCILFKCKGGKLAGEWEPLDLKEILKDFKMVEI